MKPQADIHKMSQQSKGKPAPFRLRGVRGALFFLMALMLAFAVTPKAGALQTVAMYTTPPVAIPDSNLTGIVTPLAVGIPGTIRKLTFSFDGVGSPTTDYTTTTAGLNHSWVGDLTVSLISPDGTSVTLIDRIGVPAQGTFGNDGNNFFNTVLDDAAATPIEDATAGQAPFVGTWRPNNPLSAFIGKSCLGTWQLSVSDRVGGDTGSVRRWSLHFDLEDTDFGDAPAPYPTQFSANGASHIIVPIYHLGAACDAEQDGQPSAAADRDNLASDVAILAPEDIAGGYLNSGAQFGPAVPTAGIAAPVDYYVPDPLGLAPFPAGYFQGKIALIDRGTNFFIEKSWYAQNAGAVGVIIANHAAGGDTPILMGDAGLGYVITIPCVMVGYHDGLTIKSQLGVPGGVTALLQAGRNVADEDGVAFPAFLATGAANPVGVSASGPGYLDAWIDFNRNGSWADPGEQVLTSTAVSSGPNTVFIAVPSTTTRTYDTYARFRFSSAGGLSFDGPAADGEVEDYMVTLSRVADLAVTKQSASPAVITGEITTFTIAVSNLGPSDATATTLTDTLPPMLMGPTWTASGTPGTVFTASGAGNILDVVSIPAGGSIEYTVLAWVAPGFYGYLENKVQIAAPSDADDPNLANNEDVALVKAETDCNGDGTPDDEQFTAAGPGNPYVNDDGAAEMSYGFSSAYNVAMLAPYTVAPGGEYITTVSAYIGSLPAKESLLFLLYDDPTNDGDPIDATLLRAVKLAPMNLSVAGTRETAIPPTFVGAAGQTYFVGVAFYQPAHTSPLAVDLNTTAPQLSWIMVNDSSLDLVTPSNNLLPPVTFETVGGSGCFLLHAEGCHSPQDANINGYLDECDPLDFGDAPAPYPTLRADNGARHLESAIRMGTLWDAEYDGQPSANADADSDDDGVSFFQPLIPGSSPYVQVTVKGAGRLSAWMDFNADGDWADVGEKILNDVSLTTGSYYVTPSIPRDAYAGATFARFRFSSQTGLSYTGFAPDGEVEDYTVDIQPAADLKITVQGQAPVALEGAATTFTITVSNLGPSSVAVTTVTDALPPQFISAQWTGVATPGSTCSASGFGGIFDVVSIAAGGAITYTFAAQTAPGFTGYVANVASVEAPALPYDLDVTNNRDLAWVKVERDCDQNGVADGGQVTSTGVTTLYKLDDGSYEARYGLIPQTYHMAMLQRFVVAPGAEYITSASAVLGTMASTQTLTFFLYSDPNGDGNPSDAELLQTAEAPYLRSGAAALQTAQLAPTFVGRPGDYFFVGVSFYQPAYNYPLAVDGDTLGPQNSWLMVNNSPLDIVNPADNVWPPVRLIDLGVAGTFLIRAEGCRSPQDANLNGVYDECDPLDFGDAPAPYPTLRADNGARHLTSNSLHMGSKVDADADGQPSVNADGDDLDGTADEDGVATTPTLRPGHQAHVLVNASGAGLFNAWIDFNADGDWTGAGEHVFTDVAVTTGANDLAFTVPSDAGATTAAYARFRISSASGLSYAGFAPDGEVEDYRLSIEPIADLSVTKTDGRTVAVSGQTLTYTIQVANNGPDPAVNVTVDDPLSAQITSASWTCSASPGAVFIPSGTGSIHAVISLPVGGTATYTLTAQTDPSASGTLVNTATFSGPPGIVDPVPGNNTSSDTDVLVTPQIIRNHLLSGGSTATDDVNGDGIVDVADVIRAILLSQP